MRAVVALCALVSVAHADDDTDDAAPPPIPKAPPLVTIGGYVETYYQLNFRTPSNQITNLRGFDNRDRTFTLENVALDVKGERGPIATRVIVQVGATPSTYYASEPARPGTTTVNATDGSLWKYLQQATLTYNAPRGFLVTAGLMPSPIGCEAFAIKDDWNWSRSNLFYGLPFYHTGLQASHALGEGWSATLHLYSGWNSVVDNNPYPSAGASVAYAGSGGARAQLLYMGGIERAKGAPEGNAWRNLFDVYATIPISDQVTLQGEADAGWERNRFGTSSWVAGALYAKVDLDDDLFAAARGDLFREWVADGASAIFWPTPWLGSATVTLAYRPARYLMLMLELRYDQAGTPAFFGGTVEGDGVMTPYVPNQREQQTATLGATAWF